MTDTDELRAAAQQALVALVHHTEQTRPIQRTADAIEALRAALAQPAAPVVERADSATPVVERGAGNVSHNAAPVAPARWYCVTNYGGATLCTSRADAAEVAAEQDIAVPGHGPHRAVMLAEVPPARVPLTDQQLCSMRKENLADDDAPAWAYEKGVRDAENAHGITLAQGEPK